MEKFAYVIQFSGDISEDTVATFTHQLLELEAKCSSKDVIALYLNSGGGDVRQSLAMYDLIKTSKCAIIGVVAGNCYSAAYTVLQACKRRYATHHADFMSHKGTGEMGMVHQSEFKSLALSELNMQKISDNIAFNRLIDLKTFKRYHTSGRFFNAQAALKIGSIDEIISNRFPIKS